MAVKKKKILRCKKCKKLLEKAVGQGMCRKCYDENATTNITNPKTGKLFTRKQYKVWKQCQYDKAKRALNN